MGDTSIQWTDKTWNPTRGCSLVSPGCKNCYAMGQAHRFSGQGKPFEGLTVARKKLGVVWTGKVRLVPDMLSLPLRWKKPQRVFVNSMSDLFHESLTNEEIAAVFGVMAAAPMHTFQVLTKRAKRMREWFEWIDGSTVPFTSSKTGRCLFHAGEFRRADSRLGTLCAMRVWPLPNVWLGVSAENQECANERVPELLKTPAAIRFVSYEPALGPVDWEWLSTPHARLDWIIVGGESGRGARPFDVEWARSTVAKCAAAGVACFVKQLGARPYEGPHHNPYTFRDSHGGDLAEWPADLRVRQFPVGS